MFFLMGLIQVITLTVSGWALLKIIDIGEKQAEMNGKFDTFPIQQISNNRHRIEGLEKHIEIIDLKLSNVEKLVESLKVYCAGIHNKP